MELLGVSPQELVVLVVMGAIWLIALTCMVVGAVVIVRWARGRMQSRQTSALSSGSAARS